MNRLCLILAFAFIASACTREEGGTLAILQTSDTHSCIEPEKGNRAGVVGREVFVNNMRDSVGADNLLLFDCGDFSQGSLYYNIFKGAFEVDAMNVMRYDAVTIGNHEFDFGLENLASLIKRAEYPVVCSNLDFTGTPCEGLVQPYIVIERAGRKIGVFGLSPSLEGLVLKDNYNGVEFSSPIEAAKSVVGELRDEGCTFVICLSHLGLNIPGRYSDEQLAAETEGIDVILGGHSHDSFEAPVVRKNSAGKDVVINHTGKNGRNVGVLSVTFAQ